MIIIIVVIIILIGIRLHFWYNWDIVLTAFKKCNVIVYGKKGSGKDLLTAGVIYHRNEKHYSNIIYNKNTELINIKDVSAGKNTYQSLLKGDFIKFPAQFEEKRDIYLSDCGIFLPCQYNNELNKLYPSLPVFYALSRHLYNNNVHCNTQSLTRIWDKLREQADTYIKVKRTYKFLKFLGYLFIKVVVYDEYQDAVNNLSPLKKRLLDKNESKVNILIENSSRGSIKSLILPIRMKKIEYDTRYFKSVLIDS